MAIHFPSLRGIPPGAPGDHRGFDMVRWFALVSLVCVAISGTGTGVLLSRFLTTQMLERDAQVASEFLQSVVQAERSWS